MLRTDVAKVQSEVQGNILAPYRLPCVRHLVVRVDSASRARAALATLVDPGSTGPTITSGEPYAGPQRSPCLNVGITFDGLRALGVPDERLGTFPPEFREGMVARAGRLGDVGASSARSWDERLRTPSSVHLMFTIHAETSASTAATAAEVLVAGRGGFREVGHFDGEALVEVVPGRYGLYHDVPAIAEDGTPTTRMRGEHFGFRDGLSQPFFDGIGGRRSPSEPAEPLGVVLLGHPTTSPVGVPVPAPHALGFQGSFNAFRVLGQDVAGFRQFVAAAADASGIDPELLRAKLCGRWPNGVPLDLAANADEARRRYELAHEHDPGQDGEERDLNDFDFSDDQDGRTCPVGSHIRRSNPRAAQIVQRPTNRARRLVRRGMPFGPWLENDEAQCSRRERGLLGNFVCASLSAQFEAMQYDWINLGLQDPSITSTNDPLVGANEEPTSSFTFATESGGWRTLRNLPRFVETMGGAYCFLPSMEAIHWIACARWAPASTTPA